MKTKLIITPAGQLQYKGKPLNWDDTIDLPNDVYQKEYKKLQDTLGWPIWSLDLMRQCGMDLEEVVLIGSALQTNLDAAFSRAEQLVVYPTILYRHPLLVAHKESYVPRYYAAKRKREKGRKTVEVKIPQSVAGNGKRDWAIHLVSPDRSAVLVIMNEGLSQDARWRYWGHPSRLNGELVAGTWVRHDDGGLVCPTQWCHDFNPSLDVIEDCTQDDDYRNRTWQISLPANSLWTVEGGALATLEWPGK